jgi:hypothetical protein
MQLKKFQELFVGSITLQKKSNEIEELINPVGSLTHYEALKVYSMDYQARMQEALGKNYEATWLVLGDDEFLECTREYIANYPSELTNLTSYGDNFPDLLTSKEIDLEVVQMATFEREFWRCFHAMDCPAFEINQTVLQLSSFDLSSIRLFESDMRLDAIWQNREKGSEALSEIDVYEKCYLALYKANEKVEVKILSLGAYQILLDLKKVGEISKLTAGNYSSEDWAKTLSVLMYCYPSVSCAKKE